MNHRQIREWLEKNGFTRAVAEDIIMDGKPAVVLRWEGKSHSVNGFEIEDIQEIPRRIVWLYNNFADVNLDEPIFRHKI